MCEQKVTQIPALIPWSRDCTGTAQKDLILLTERLDLIIKVRSVNREADLKHGEE